MVKVVVSFICNYKSAKRGACMKKIIGVVIVVIVTLSLCFSIDGAEDSYVMHNFSPFALKNVESRVLNGFSETNEGWDSDSTKVNVTLTEQIKAFPFGSLTGEG